MSLPHVTVALLALTTIGCKDKPAEPVLGDKAPKPTDPAADKPADKAAEKPADKAVEPAAAGPTWKSFTSKEGKFTIDLPGEPKEQDQGQIKIVGAEFGTTGSDSRTAMCGAAFMAMGDAAKADPKVILEGAIARHKEGAKVIEDKDVKLGKYPGKSIVVENSSHRKWMRVYLVDGTIYILNCGGPFDRAAADGPIATKVLDSFKLAN